MKAGLRVEFKTVRKGGETATIALELPKLNCFLFVGLDYSFVSHILLQLGTENIQKMGKRHPPKGVMPSKNQEHYNGALVCVLPPRWWEFPM